MTVEEVEKALKDRRIDMVRAKTGLSRSTIIAIRDGKNKNPTTHTLNQLVNYLTGEA